MSIDFANFAKAVSNHIMAVFLPPYYATKRSANFEMSFRYLQFSQKTNKKFDFTTYSEVSIIRPGRSRLLEFEI